MKKIGIGLGIFIVIFVLLTYYSISSTATKKSSSVIQNVEDINTIDFFEYDSVLVAPSLFYKANTVKEIMQGEQYRKAWSTPNYFPVLNLDSLLGGMKILKEGGGKQTHSLKMESKDGYIFTLRSINKDPQPLVPEWAKTLGLENIVVDGISAQHPYAAMAVAQLAQKSKILHTDPNAIFLPKQDVLGAYNKDFGNKIYLLEHETEGGKNWTPLENVESILDTDDLQELKLEVGPRLSIDEKALVRARLFDIVIGDWDRHSKQWGWVIVKNNGNYKAIPLPGDRDNAFFSMEGIIPTLISNKLVLSDLQSFDDDVDYLPGLVMPFDVYFLKNTPREIFISEAKNLKSLLTNTAIQQSFNIWPQSIYELDGEDIIKNIQTRRDNLIQIATEFHAIIKNNDFLEEPLKGSEDLELPISLLRCFDCP